MQQHTFERIFPVPSFLAMPAAGIDISDKSIKYVTLKRAHKTVVVDQYGSEQLPAGVIDSGEITDADALKDHLRTIREKLNTPFVRISLPEEQMYLFKLTIPDIAPDEIRNSIELQLEEHVPLPVSEVVFDFDVITSGENGHVVQVTVLPQSVIENYAELFEGTELIPLSFEVEAQAIARSVVDDVADDGYMIIDFGATRTTLSIARGQTVVFTSTIDIGGQALTKRIKEEHNVSLKEAEQMKREVGLIRRDGDEELFNLLINSLSVLRDEINRHFVYWHTHPDETGKQRTTITKLILCGGEANLKGLSDYLARSLKVPIELANPWRNLLSFQTHIPHIPHDASMSYVTAIGLAMRNFYHD